VSLGLLYRYFPSKEALVFALYDEVSADFATGAAEIPPGPWVQRFFAALRLSLAVLGPHRELLRVLGPSLFGLSDPLYAPTTLFSRERVQPRFEELVRTATDAPPAAAARRLGEGLYLAHLGVVLFWLIDRSPGQRATGELVDLLVRLAGAVPLPVLAPLVGPFAARFAELMSQAVFGEVRS
jgi:AcrR family transcriptional regulator